MAFHPAIFNPVEDIVVAAPLLLFAFNPLPRLPLLFRRLAHLLFALNPLPRLPLLVGSLPHLPVTLNPFSFLPVALGPFAYLLVEIGTFTLFPFYPYPFTGLSFTLNPLPVPAVVLHSGLQTIPARVLLKAGTGRL